MEQDQQPHTPELTPNLDAGPTPAPPAAPANPPEKPKLIISEKEAQAILAINNLEASQQPKTKPPIKILIALAVLVVLVVLASFLLDAYKPGKTSNPTSIGLPNQSNPTNSSGVSNQINQDVKSCSNLVNASLVC